MKINSDLITDLVFTVDDVAKTLGINPASARVLCSRYVKNGKILRIRNNLYVLTERWKYISTEERLRIANQVQVPSYISLATAINYYELSEQMYRNRIESIAQKRSIEYPVRDIIYSYHLINSTYYQGYTLKNGLFIAEPEKALADIIYFSSINHYAFDFSALMWERLDRDRLAHWLALLPERNRQWWEKHGYFSET